MAMGAVYPFWKGNNRTGQPRRGKTTLALRLCAASTNRKPFPAMAEHEPFNVIYQTAEDGLGDTVKPAPYGSGRRP